jgi:hypothetical protein
MVKANFTIVEIPIRIIINFPPPPLPTHFLKFHDTGV